MNRADVAEMLSLLGPAAMSYQRDGSAGGKRQQLAVALGLVPTWPQSVLRSLYVRDPDEPRHLVRYLVAEASNWWGIPDKPGQMHHIAALTVSGWLDPPLCPACGGRRHEWRMDGTVNEQRPCGTCAGAGRIAPSPPDDPDMLPRYRRMRATLRGWRDEGLARMVELLAAEDAA